MEEQQAKQEREELKALGNDLLIHVDLGEIKYCAVAEADGVLIINYESGELQAGDHLTLNSVFST